MGSTVVNRLFVIMIYLAAWGLSKVCGGNSQGYEVSFYSEPLTWNEAQAVCCMSGSQLYIPNTAEKMNDLENMLKYDPALAVLESLWIGVYVTLDGDVMTVAGDVVGGTGYSHWDVGGAPYGTSALCIFLTDRGRMWHSGGCTKTRAFACERLGGPCWFDVFEDNSFLGASSQTSETTTVQECQNACFWNEGADFGIQCLHFVFSLSRCHLTMGQNISVAEHDLPVMYSSNNTTSGAKRCYAYVLISGVQSLPSIPSDPDPHATCDTATMQLTTATAVNTQVTSSEVTSYVTLTPSLASATSSTVAVIGPSTTHSETPFPHSSGDTSAPIWETSMSLQLSTSLQSEETLKTSTGVLSTSSWLDVQDSSTTATSAGSAEALSSWPHGESIPLETSTQPDAGSTGDFFSSPKDSFFATETATEALLSAASASYSDLGTMSQPLPAQPKKSVDASTSAVSSASSSSATAVGDARTPKRQCKCPCGKESLQVVKEVINSVVSELTVEKSSLSSVRRKVTSAPDVRPTAAMTGWMGVTLLCLTFLLLVAPDIARLVSFARTHRSEASGSADST